VLELVVFGVRSDGLEQALRFLSMEGPDVLAEQSGEIGRDKKERQESPSPQNSEQPN
jgi:hypothetical protein